MHDYQIIPLSEDHFSDVVHFSDRWIGENYFKHQDLQKILKASQKEGLNSSLLAFQGDTLIGIRLTFSPGQLTVNKHLTPHEWKVELSKVGYFKSLFISDEHQQRGIGKVLSIKSMDILKNMGGEAVLCHSWLESPENSSQRYLESLGFVKVKDHPNFWYDTDYKCVRCAPSRCLCTSVEMIKYF